MKVLSEEELESAINLATSPLSHPIRDWLDTALLENVGLGDAGAVEKLNKRRTGRGISPADFKASKDSAERTGRLGEELLDQFFRTPDLSGISSHEWVAQTNAISPFDFRLIVEDGSERHSDAKSTSGKFTNPIYMSVAEILHAVNSGIPYDIYRLFNVNETSASLRVARNVGPRLTLALDALKLIPTGVSVDSLSFEPSFFEFETTDHLIEVTDLGESEQPDES